MNRTVVGIDPSLTSAGLAVTSPAGSGAVSLYRVQSTGRASATWEQRYERIDAHTANILAHVPAGALVVIEAPAYSRNVGSAFDRAGLWWRIYDGARALGCPVLALTPQTRAMYATGRGNAGKDEVLAAVVRRYAAAAVTGNDVADALVFAAIGARLLGFPLETALPKTHLRALDKVTLPGARTPAA